MAFEKKAQRRNSKLRLALSGPSGSGKTFTALLIAAILGGLRGLIDSEQSSAEKYAQVDGTEEGPGNWDFRHENLVDKTPQEYREKIRDAAEAGIEVLLIDSFSQSWQAALEIVDKMGGWVKAGKNVSPMVARLVSAIVSYPGHVIVTFRAKAEHVIEKNEKGQNTIRKLGMAPIAREGTEYEFDMWLDLALDGTMTVTKSRCSAVPVGEVYSREQIPEVVAKIREWLDTGAELTPREHFEQKIKFAQTDDELVALVPELQKLSPEDRQTLKPIYGARKQAIATGAI